MSLQLVIGRADVPRAGRAAERDVERDAEQGKASPGREQRWGRTGDASLSSWRDAGLWIRGNVLPGSAPRCWGWSREVGEEERQLPTGDEWLPINTCQGARKRWVDYPPHSMR